MSQDDQPIEMPRRPARWPVVAIVLVGAAVPLVVYWLVLGRVPTVTPAEAKEMLGNDGETAVLVDVSPAADFHKRHIDGAVNWPLAEILALQRRDDVPARFQGKTLLLICNAGISSARAARHLADLGVTDVASVRGGRQAWVGSTEGRQGGPFERWRAASGRIEEFAFRESPGYEQFAAVVVAFVVKPLYTTLALVLAIVLWRSRAPDLAALRWAMIFFFVGENCCATNYIFFDGRSYLLEYCHGFGMLLCFGFATYALLEALDRRVMMVTDPDRRCAALGLCGRCIKYADAPCGLKRTFLFLTPVCIALAFMPLLADMHYESYNTQIYATFYNYSHFVIYQLFENKYCPIAAIAMLSTALVILIADRREPIPRAKIAFAAGIGPLGFGLLRMTLGGVYAHNLVWFSVWEETTELMFIAAACFLVWTFRRGLFPRRAS